jgi:ribosomal protein S8
MSLSDPIADMLTRLQRRDCGHSSVAMPNSKIKAAIAQILKERLHGGVETPKIVSNQRKILRIRLKYIGERRERNPSSPA